MDDNRFRLIHQKDRGVSSARNIGINNARSELVAFLDADDEWLPIHLETILSLRQKYPYAGAYTTSYIFFEEHGKIIKPRYREIPLLHGKGLFQIISDRLSEMLRYGPRSFAFQKPY